MNKSRAIKAILLIVVILLADQLLKIWVKTHFYLGESVEITPWFQLLFVQNNGMAFGMEIGSKLFLSVFRVAAMFVGAWYIYKLLTNPRFSLGFILCVAAIIAGTVGNIIDCLFYGLIFNNPMPPEVATLFPADGGYAPFLHGRVVDMLYFPLFSFVWPEWLPVLGGKEFLFFQPVFNIADAAISVGIILILIFYSRCFAEPLNVKDTDSEQTETPHADEK